MASIPDQADIVELARQLNLAADSVNNIGVSDHEALNDVINTHCAYLVMGEQFVLKIKRAVKYDYLDMSTLALRQQLCQRELELNQGTLPDIYLDVLPLTLHDSAGLELDGSGDIVEWALVMRRFNENDVLDSVADSGGLTTEICYELGQQVNQYHAALEPVLVDDGDERIREVIEELGRVFAELTKNVDPDQAEQLVGNMRTEFDHCQALLLDRGEQGFIKRCHGDLHLRNLVFHNGKPVPFDALEFDERLATTDVLYDVAFLLSDMASRGLTEDSNAVLNGYVQSLPHIELDGLRLLPLFVSIRSAILGMTTAQRATVDSVAGSASTECGHYLNHALQQLETGKPVLVAIGGLSGSGKSSVARAIAPALGSPCGAIHLNSDIERKRMAGVESTDPLPAESYTQESSLQTYLGLIERCGHLINARQSIIVDATFLQADYQQMIGSVAGSYEIPFVGLWLDTSPEILKSRIAARTNDVSDANLEVLEKQLARDMALQNRESWVEIDAGGSLEEVTALVLDKIRTP